MDSSPERDRNCTQERRAFQTPSNEPRELATLVYALDISAHTIGRYHRHLHLWRQHCTGRQGTEEVTGLPHNLVDLFANSLESGIENRHMRWPGASGEPTLRETWGASHTTGMILSHKVRSSLGIAVSFDRKSNLSVVQQTILMLQELRTVMDLRIFSNTGMILVL